MNKGVEILLARMDSSPEEFVTGNKAGKWQHLIEKYEDYMTEEECKAVRTKYNELKMGKFTEAVMKELLEEKEEAPNPFVQATMAGAGQTHAQSLAAQQAQAQISMYHQQAQQQQLAQRLSGVSSLASWGEPPTPVLSIDGETLTGKMVKKLKRLLK